MIASSIALSGTAAVTLAILVVALGFVALGIGLLFLGLSRRHRDGASRR